VNVLLSEMETKRKGEYLFPIYEKYASSTPQ
jgi:hypothetical protein